MTIECDYWGEDYLENIKSWMKREHENYPAYTYENLMTLGYICAEDKYYDNISDEIRKIYGNGSVSEKSG